MDTILTVFSLVRKHGQNQWANSPQVMDGIEFVKRQKNILREKTARPRVGVPLPNNLTRARLAQALIKSPGKRKNRTF